MNRWILTLLCITLICLLGATAAAQEAKNERPVKRAINPMDVIDEVVGEKGSGFTDIEREPRTFAINDIVKIRITETQTQSDNAKMETQRDMEVNASLSKFLHLTTDTDGFPVKLEDGNPSFEPGVEMTSEVERDSQAKSTRQVTFKTYIAAKVIDVKPNNTIVISASKSITTSAGEKRTVTLSGICAANDVDLNNTVDSNEIADLVLVEEGDGPITDNFKRSWLGELFDKVWPF